MSTARARTQAFLPMVCGVIAALVVLSPLATASPASPSARLHWHQLTTPIAPSPRDRAGFAYDPADGYAVMYGGYDANVPTFYYDTWTFAAGTWTKISPANHPPAPTGFVLAYDPVLKGILEFGGESPYGGTYYNETWLFQSGNWTQLYPTNSPPSRSQYAMAYDSSDSEMVLFGGLNGGSAQYLSDTWAFNGTTWTEVHSAKSPPGRQQAQMVYDASLGKVLLFGGSNLTTGLLSDTWAFGGGSWKLLKGTHAPLRSYPEASILSNGTPIQFGGQTPAGIYNTSFEFFSGAWHKVDLTNRPPPRSIGSMTYDSRAKETILFAGFTYGYSYLNDTWTLR